LIATGPCEQYPQVFVLPFATVLAIVQLHGTVAHLISYCCTINLLLPSLDTTWTNSGDPDPAEPEVRESFVLGQTIAEACGGRRPGRSPWPRKPREYQTSARFLSFGAAAVKSSGSGANSERRSKRRIFLSLCCNASCCFG
jgi:hypothetical protein